jgi:hypothetical protein
VPPTGAGGRVRKGPPDGVPVQHLDVAAEQHGGHEQGADRRVGVDLLLQQLDENRRALGVADDDDGLAAVAGQELPPGGHHVAVGDGGDRGARRRAGQQAAQGGLPVDRRPHLAGPGELAGLLDRGLPDNRLRFQRGVQRGAADDRRVHVKAVERRVRGVAGQSRGAVTGRAHGGRGGADRAGVAGHPRAAEPDDAVAARYGRRGRCALSGGCPLSGRHRRRGGRVRAGRRADGGGGQQCHHDGRAARRRGPGYPTSHRAAAHWPSSMSTG